MKARGGGRIINITTVEGKSPGKESVPTSVSRAAGIALTKAMSKEYAKHNILVNTLCIGLIKSAQHVRHWQDEGLRNPKLTLKQWYEREGKEIPLGRYGEPKEAGDLIAFLASQRASYIAGTAINLDGGAAPVV
jgi:NAD(P)-dependent dehydrogenase (short-subunit alcohol dehydrogenase family)